MRHRAITAALAFPPPPPSLPNNHAGCQLMSPTATRYLSTTLVLSKRLSHEAGENKTTNWRTGSGQGLHLMVPACLPPLTRRSQPPSDRPTRPGWDARHSYNGHSLKPYFLTSVHTHTTDPMGRQRHPNTARQRDARVTCST
ncbi:hypothetical protein E2C01_023459 [Portunus trituberculatus]|uniref:Uncharacterized protein n=1 Tax=Portunus trituberculatus TaxID=210409 RepID=A0A5B7E9W1_PORTR|nr:hypothetical protein [Portunus trituberculatus]